MRRIKPSKTRFTRRLRHDMTDAERLLWRHLRLRQMDGFKFRRQYPIGKYIADFVCPEAGLAIEVDGVQHAEQVVSDRIRAEELEAQGLRVLRFWNHEVLQDIESVKVAIWNALHDEASHPHPIPSPFQGEGEEGGGAQETAIRHALHGDAQHPHPILPPSRGKVG